MIYDNMLLFSEEPLVMSRPLVRLLKSEKEAIVLQQIHYWLQVNKRKKVNYRDGRYWTYNSVKSWHEENFDIWSYDTVKRTLAQLENKGLLITCKSYNPKGYDQTKWYTIDYDKLASLYGEYSLERSDKSQNDHCAESHNALVHDAPMEMSNGDQMHHTMVHHAPDRGAPCTNQYLRLSSKILPESSFSAPAMRDNRMLSHDTSQAMDFIINESQNEWNELNRNSSQKIANMSKHKRKRQ